VAKYAQWTTLTAIRARRSITGRAHLLAIFGGPGALSPDVWTVLSDCGFTEGLTGLPGGRNWGTREYGTVDDLNAEAAALISEQARQQLNQQNDDLDVLRTRAVAMLSVAALVAGLFGARLPGGHANARTVGFVIVALVLFAASVVLAVIVAAPRRNWEFTFRLGALLERVDAGKAVPADVTRNLAAWSETARLNNAQRMEHLHNMFRVVCFLVGFQVVAWAIAVL
jgi:hypothetical protein